MPVKSVYKGLCYTGFLSLVIYLACEGLLTTDDTGWDFDFGIWPTVLMSVVMLLVFISFLLPLLYLKSNNERLFIILLITGIIAIAFPAWGFWIHIERWLQPKPAFEFPDIFSKTSAFRKNLRSIQEIIFDCWFIIQFVLLLLTFKIRKLKLEATAE